MECKKEITKFTNLKKIIIVPENLLSTDADEYLKVKKYEFTRKEKSINKEKCGYVEVYFQETLYDKSSPTVDLKLIKRKDNADWDNASFIDMIQSLYLRLNFNRDQMSKMIKCQAK